MKSKIIIEDTLTGYFDRVFKDVHNEQKLNKLLTELAYYVTKDNISPLVPKLNWNLVRSGRNDEFWEYFHSKHMASVTILYTGFVGEGNSAPDDTYVFWEFGQKHVGGYEDILARDYALYQEVGEDIFAPKEEVKAPSFPGHHYVEWGLLEAEEEGLIHDFVEEYFYQILGVK